MMNEHIDGISEKQQRKPFFGNLKISKWTLIWLVRMIAALFFVGLGVVAVYYYRQYVEIRRNPDMVKQEENVALLAKVGNMIELPQGETPAIGTISDREKLKGKEFFENSENGDKLLVFSKGGMAIIFRPSVNKIIRVTPLTSGDESMKTNENTFDGQGGVTATLPESDSEKSITPSEATASHSETLNVAIENGTTIVGLASKAQSLLSDIGDFNFIPVRRAGKSDYDKTIIVDLTKKNVAKAEEIKQKLDGEMSSVPEGESVPEGADILVIIGGKI